MVLAFVPDLFVGMGFDAGRRFGPMTARSPWLRQDRRASADRRRVADGLAIAIVAMTPIIAIEILGALYHARSKSAKSRNLKAINRRLSWISQRKNDC